MDAIEKYNQSQYNAARAIGPSLRRQFLKASIDAGRAALMAQGHEADNKDLQALCRSDLERNTFVAVKGYTEWLSSKLWRDGAVGMAGPLPLPPCTPEDRNMLSKFYDVRPDVLDAAIDALCNTPKGEGITVLPAGRIYQDKIVVFDSLLKEWAGQFNWAMPATRAFTAPAPK